MTFAGFNGTNGATVANEDGWTADGFSTYDTTKSAAIVEGTGCMKISASNGAGYMSNKTTADGQAVGAYFYLSALPASGKYLMFFASWTASFAGLTGFGVNSAGKFVYISPTGTVTAFGSNGDIAVNSLFRVEVYLGSSGDGRLFKGANVNGTTPSVLSTGYYLSEADDVTGLGIGVLAGVYGSDAMATANPGDAWMDRLAYAVGSYPGPGTSPYSSTTGPAPVLVRAPQGVAAANVALTTGQPVQPRIPTLGTYSGGTGVALTAGAPCTARTTPTGVAGAYGSPRAVWFDGSSIPGGLGPTAKTATIPYVLQQLLRTNFPTGAMGSAGAGDSWFAPWRAIPGDQPSWAAVDIVSTNGTVTDEENSTPFGGQSSLFANSSSNRTWQIAAADVPAGHTASLTLVWQNPLGTAITAGTYSVDGGGAVNLTSAATTGYQTTTVSLTAGASHTLRFDGGATAGSLRVLGWAVHDGADTDSWRVAMAGHVARDSAALAVADANRDAYLASQHVGLYLVDPFTNDALNGVAASTSKTNTLAYIAARKATAASVGDPMPNFGLVVFEDTSAVSGNSPAAYLAVAAQIAAADPTVQVIDLSGLLPASGSVGAATAYVDNIHPTNSTASTIAAYIYAALYPTASPSPFSTTTGPGLVFASSPRGTSTSGAGFTTGPVLLGADAATGTSTTSSSFTAGPSPSPLNPARGSWTSGLTFTTSAAPTAVIPPVGKVTGLLSYAATTGTGTVRGTAPLGGLTVPTPSTPGVMRPAALPVPQMLPRPNPVPTMRGTSG